jgi:hypothetical protein
MELLVLLLVLTAVNVALWLGWGTDSRERDNNWHPAAPARRASAERVHDRLDPAQPHLAGGHPDVVTC